MPVSYSNAPYGAEKSTLKHKAVSACVVGVFRKIRFAADDNEAHVSYPLLFSAP